MEYKVHDQAASANACGPEGQHIRQRRKRYQYRGAGIHLQQLLWSK